MPAFKAAMAAENAEIAAIADNPAPASFANTLEALEQTGEMLKRVSSNFHLLTGTCSSDELQTIDEDVSPLLSRHATAIGQNEKLFARIDAVYKEREQSDPRAGPAGGGVSLQLPAGWRRSATRRERTDCHHQRPAIGNFYRVRQPPAQ
jgi:hypothetical protein